MLDSQLEESGTVPGWVECTYCEKLYPKENGYISTRYPSYFDSFCSDECVDEYEKELEDNE